MSEEVRVLKEILDNVDLDNYTIDDDECYLNGYARKCLKKVLDQLQQKENIIKEVREYIEDRQEDINNGGNEHEYRVNKHILEILDKGEKNELR